MRRTKIGHYWTRKREAGDLAGLVEGGMEIARLNLSHGSREDHLRR